MQRTGVPGIILDGQLSRIPAVYRRLGPVLGVAAHGNRLADTADALLAKYRGALSSGDPVRVYLYHLDLTDAQLPRLLRQ